MRRLRVAPLVAAYLCRCPEVELDLVLTDSLLDLVEEGIDLALRIGVVADESLIARRLASHRRVVCGSPAYLRARGLPARPGDLVRHACLLFRYGPGPLRWRFEAQGEIEEVSVRGPLCANNAEVLREAAIGSAGLALLPTWLVGEDLAEGRLEAVLTNHRAAPGPIDGGIHAIYLPSRRGSSKVRSFVDFLAASFSPEPPWERHAQGTARRRRSKKGA